MAIYYQKKLQKLFCNGDHNSLYILNKITFKNILLFVQFNNKTGYKIKVLRGFGYECRRETARCRI